MKTNEYRIRIKYNPNNLISESAWERLSGHTRLFVFAYVENISKNEIIARPYLIGDIHNDLESSDKNNWRFRNYGEIYVPEIDSFNKIKEIYENEKQAPNLKILKDIPEKNIKKAFAEVLHEGNIPKDWGGERSDLFTTMLKIDGKQKSAAFCFKGPARSSPMTLSHLGKNGDQIDRLFTEPADIFILQHCHKITTAVRSTMRAYASRIYDLKHFAIIDGYDTIRILKAYGKI